MKLCQRERIDNLHSHDLHDEAKSRLFEKGLNPVEAAMIAGHKDADALYTFKSRGFSGGIEVITTSFPLENQLFKAITKVPRTLCS